MKNRIVSIVLALSLSVCMMVGFGPSASAYSVPPSNFGVYPFVSFHLNGESFYRAVYYTEVLAPHTSYEYKLYSQHDPEAFGFLIDFFGHNDAGYVHIAGLTPTFMPDSSSSAYIWRTAQRSGTWASTFPAMFPLYYQWVSQTDAFPDFSSPGVLWDGGSIPVPYNGQNQGRLYLFIYAYNPSSDSGWYGFTTSDTFSVSFVDSFTDLYLFNVLAALTNSQGTNPLLSSILTSVNQIKESSGQQSPMDKFESDYLTNFQYQVNKTEDYIGSSSPVLPNNFVSSSSGGSSFVDSVKDNIGLSSDSLDMSDFANASQSFSGSASTGDGGMWQFFTQEVADSMSTGGTATIGLDDALPSDFESELSKWLEDSERWLEKWSNP